MKTTIDAAGRLVIPRDIRRRAALEHGMTLDVRIREGVIEIEPAPIPVRLVQRGHVVTIVPESAMEPLTSASIEPHRADLERERGLR